MAVVGGSNVLLSHDMMVSMSMMRFVKAGVQGMIFLTSEGLFPPMAGRTPMITERTGTVEAKELPAFFSSLSNWHCKTATPSEQ